MSLIDVSNIIVSLLTLIFLELVLGIDNIIFLTIVVNRLPPQKRNLARRIGLSLAWVFRLLLLASVWWIAQLKKPLFTAFHHAVSIHDLLFILGGCYLLISATLEIHNEFDAPQKNKKKKFRISTTFVIFEIALLDLIFSIDSVVTAVALTKRYWVMATAITISILGMAMTSNFLGRILNDFPTIKMLGLSFLIMIGMVLLADGFHFDIPRNYIYFAMGFSLLVETLNIVRTKKRSSK